MKVPKKGRAKEEHLAPTEIKQNDATNTVKAEKYLSDKEVQERLDLYSKGSQEQFFKIQNIKKHYTEKINKTQIRRSKEDFYYGQGIRAGLPHTDHDNIKNVRELQDQDYRDLVIKEAKMEYKKHENLTKSFDRETGTKNPNPSIRTNKKKEKVYDKLGKLIGEFKAVQSAKNKAVDHLKQLQSGTVYQNDNKDTEPDKKSSNKQQNSLSRYFKTHQPTAKQVRKGFKQIQRKDRDR